MKTDPSILSFPRKRESKPVPVKTGNGIIRILIPRIKCGAGPAGVYPVGKRGRNDTANDHVQTLPNGTTLVDYGPMRMSISVFENGNPLIDLALEGGHLAIKLLDDLARFLPVIKRKSQMIEVKELFPDVVKKMIRSTKIMGEPDLTPLAAVAGAASEVVADFIIRQGGTKVIVDNGGDISIQLRENEVAKIGVKTEISAKHPSYLFTIDSTTGIKGIATSGLGGRSFTKGIASAATVLSETASISDAAATVIGNFTKVEDFDLELVGAEIADIISKIDTLKLSTESFFLKFGLNDSLLMIYSLTVNYFLIVLADKTVITGKLKFYIDLYKSQLMSEL